MVVSLGEMGEISDDVCFLLRSMEGGKGRNDFANKREDRRWITHVL